VPPLLDVLKTIHDNPDDEVSVDSVELWRGDELVAGELGFITHNAYASLCGFHIEDNSGTVQMAALGTWLKENGFAYWDLGMEMEYKYVYGAICMGRRAQKEYYDRLGPTRIALPKEGIKIKDLIK
jgi:leucyl/phenylalanyl-tRNA--protein transferase